MYQRILVAIDETDATLRALHEALALAREQNARIRLVHAFKTPGASGSRRGAHFATRRLDARVAAQRALDRAAAQVRRSGIEPELARIEDPTRSVSRMLTAEAERWQADLIVMGTHGRGGLRRVLLGSVAEEVLRHAPVPVLLVRRPSRAAVDMSTKPTSRKREA